jgi:hypothetical protein
MLPIEERICICCGIPANQGLCPECHAVKAACDLVLDASEAVESMSLDFVQ